MARLAAYSVLVIVKNENGEYLLRKRGYRVFESQSEAEGPFIVISKALFRGY